ncbi:MAG TPA: hypothetical protein PK263_03585 [bacterium]|nr:hypothetical protein [bacterium]
MSRLTEAFSVAHVGIRKALGQHKGFSIEGELVGTHGTTPPLNALVELVSVWLNAIAWTSQPLTFKLEVARCEIPARTFRGVKVLGTRPYDKKSLELLIRPEGSLKQYRGWLDCLDEYDATIVLSNSNPELLAYCLRQASPAISDQRGSKLEQHKQCLSESANKADTSWRRLGKRLVLRQFCWTLLHDYRDVSSVEKANIAAALCQVGIQVSVEDDKFEEILNMLIMRGLLDPLILGGFGLSPALDEYATEWQLHTVRLEIEKANEAWRLQNSARRSAKRELAKAEDALRTARKRAEAARASESCANEHLSALRAQEAALIGVEICAEN